MQNLWEFAAGLGIFLYAMYLLEDSLKLLMGRTAKLFLKKHTDNRLKAVASGALITGALQSSSVVILMTLAFVGAGLIQMKNALALVIGSNFGTTLDSWVVATLGFKFDIAYIAMPFIAVAGSLILVVNHQRKFFQLLRFALGFGFIFLGLGFMKESISRLLDGFDFAAYADYGLLTFVLMGFVITMLIQSSSATKVIVLSTLNTGALPFDMAVAVIIGSELGTTVKIVLGAMGGKAAKKRLALGNVIFNVVIVLVGYIFIHPIVNGILWITGPREPLIALVMFQSALNLVGVLLFVPFLNTFARFLEKRFTGNNHSNTKFLDTASIQEPGTALEALEKETGFFLHRVLQLNLEAFHINQPVIQTSQDLPEKTDKKAAAFFAERYDNIKYSEGEILSFYFKLRKENMNENDSKRADQLVSAVRDAMYSAKSMKDVLHNRIDFRESADDSKYAHYKFFQEQLRLFYIQVNDTLGCEEQEQILQLLLQLTATASTDYDKRTKQIYQVAGQGGLAETDISSMLNVSRELFSAGKSVIRALRDYLLDEKHAAEFDNRVNVQ